MLPIKVLLVDDENELRLNLKENLESLGWTIDTAENGSAALNQLNKFKYDLVISDICMPVMSGYQLLQAFRCLDLDTPFILMSGFNDIPIWDCYASGAYGLIGKPFRLEDLSLLVDTALQPRQLRWKDLAKLTENSIIKTHIQLEWDNSMSNLSFGRGGMFMNPGNILVIKGQIVSFAIVSPFGLIEGVGKIQWRRGLQKSTLAPGLGIEFLYLEDPFRTRFASIIAKSQEIAFIPKGAHTTIALD